jgi:hypothetical protein
MTYATRWAQAWSTVAAVGVGFASLQWSPVIVTLDLVATGAGAASCLAILQARRTRPTTGPPSRRFPDIGRRSLMLTCCVVALTTLTIASPVLALLAVLLAAATSPVVVQLRASSARSGPLPPPAGARAQPPGTHQTSLGQLSDDELFRLWRHTFWKLRSQPNIDELAGLVSLRQSCLDELARRNPIALQAWLDSGARASGGPERFWRSRQDHGEPGEGT